MHKELVDLSHLVGGSCFVIKDAFSEEECNTLILEEYYKAGTHYPTSYRNNSRFVEDDTLLANKLFNSISQYIPQEICDSYGKWKFVKINERLRFCRYLEGQYFNKHLDGVYHISKTIQSKLTFMIYLNGNNNFKGGETLFFPSKQSDDITYRFLPDRGDLIIFDHNIWHSGAPLFSGKKYILRSDLLYELQTTDEINILNHNHLGYIWDTIVFDNKYIVSSSRDCTIKLWDLNLNLLESIEASSYSTLTLLQLSPLTLVSACRDTSITLWSIIDDKLKIIKVVKNCHKGAILDLEKINESIFLSSSADGNIKKWNINGEELGIFNVHSDWIWQIKVLDVSEFIICTVSEDYTIKIWQIIDNNFTILSSINVNEPCTSCIFDISNRMLYVGSNSGSIYYFTIDNNWKLIKEGSWIAHKGKITCFLIDYCKNILYSSSEDMSIGIWNLTDKLLCNRYYHQNFVTSLSFIDSSRFISGSYDGTLKIWNRV